MLEYFENPDESDSRADFIEFLETCRQHNISGASLDAEIDGAIREAYERLHETYGQNYRIPHFCRLDSGLRILQFLKTSFFAITSRILRILTEHI